MKYDILRGKEGVMMKKFLAILCTFVACFVGTALLFVSLISYFISEKSLKNMVKEIPFDDIIEEVKETDEVQALYDQAETQGIKRETIDSILSKEEIKDYVGGLMSEALNSAIEGKSFEDNKKIQELTEDFVEDITDTYDIELTDEMKKDLENITNNTLNNEQASKIMDQTKEESDMFAFLRFCKDKTVKGILYLTMGLLFLAILLFTWKKKSFFTYYSFIFLELALNVSAITALFHFLMKEIGKEEDFAILNIFKPLFKNGYTLGIIFLVSSIILFILHEVIKHNITKKEAIPA